MPRKCYLTCLLNSHPPIPLPHNIETIIGRSKLTKIKDQSCSRNQLSIKADCENCSVELKQLGLNPSGFDGFSMTKDAIYKVGHNTRIEVLLNNHVHLLKFDPPPVDHSKAEGKRKLEDMEPEQSSRKSMKMEGDSKPCDVKAAPESVWENVDSGELYIYTAKGVKSSEKIAAFDMDGTLITPKSGKVYPVDISDWKIAFPTVAQKLKEQIELGFKVIILSNQAPIGSGRVKIEDFKKKIENIVRKLDVPIQAYIATGKGFYRKPTTGMWKVLSEEKNDGLVIDMEKSFYCGDAAGRTANWAPGKKKDHSMADKLMAENLGLTFYTPEEFFLGHKLSDVLMKKPDFHPKQYTPEPFDQRLISSEKEILVLVGFPGSGKSFIAREIIKKSDNRYVSVCRDELGSWQKCASTATKFIQQGKSVIVDSTNPDRESRARWTALATELGVGSRCAKMAASLAHARHNNKYRELRKEKHLPVSDIVFHSYKNKFVEPSTKEGFKEVLTVKFTGTFENEEAEKMYKLHLLEK
ncbi:unnamed protein product [Plutella xylostella]|uniref:(diamondback moth) hypothetical protein n=1 Tax=Plutella xylostella TaxID=51655 RepID=A0A8S4DP10_PLUXY|nr:unnamed protein product [Plutella xylostella]